MCSTDWPIALRQLTRDLLIALAALPASRLLPSTGGGVDITDDIVKLRSLVSSNDFNPDRIVETSNGSLVLRAGPELRTCTGSVAAEYSFALAKGNANGNGILKEHAQLMIPASRNPLRSLPSRESKTSREFRSPRESGIRRDGSERRIGLVASALVVMVVVFPVLTRARLNWS